MDEETKANKEIPTEMTEAQWEIFQKYTQGYGDQDENGIDLSLLRENLKRTPTERLECLRRDLLFFQEARHIRNP